MRALAMSKLEGAETSILRWDVSIGVAVWVASLSTSAYLTFRTTSPSMEWLSSGGVVLVLLAGATLQLLLRSLWAGWWLHRLDVFAQPRPRVGAPLSTHWGRPPRWESPPLAWTRSESWSFAILMLVVLFNWVRIMLSLESRAGFDVSFVVDGAPVWQHAVISMWVPAIFVLMRRAVPFGRPSAGDALTAGFMLRLGRRDYDVKSAALLREAVENLISTDFRSQLQHTRNVLSRLASTANRDDIRSDAATSLRAIEEASRLWRSRWYRYFANGATIVVLRHEALRALLDPV